jgi:hypothetical protein
MSTTQKCVCNHNFNTVQLFILLTPAPFRIEPASGYPSISHRNRQLDFYEIWVNVGGCWRTLVEAGGSWLIVWRQLGAVPVWLGNSYRLPPGFPSAFHDQSAQYIHTHLYSVVGTPPSPPPSLYEAGRGRVGTVYQPHTKGPWSLILKSSSARR